MKDLDFDELDRAVNSIMSGMPGTKNVQDVNTTEGSQGSTTDPDTATQENAPVAPASSDGVISSSEADGQPSPPSQGSERKPPVAARRGRFMDVVRPGAVQQTDVVPRRVSRQGVAVEPSRPLVTDIVALPTMSAAKPSVLADTPMSDKTGSSTMPNKTDWPDPIDMQQNDSTGGSEPLTSPFLSNAKVEKRPLGSAATTPKADVDIKEGDMSNDQRETNAQLTPNPTEVSTPLPEELSSDVMALESDANTIAMPAEEVKTEVARQVAEQRDVTKEPVEQAVSTEASAEVKKEAEQSTSSTTPDPIVPKGPISIPQQYREEPSTGDKENGSIYDTDTYHDQPLAHPRKKKSGWLWVVWIILILVIGAAGGAALYWLGVF